MLERMDLYLGGESVFERTENAQYKNNVSHDAKLDILRFYKYSGVISIATGGFILIYYGHDTGDSPLVMWNATFFECVPGDDATETINETVNRLFELRSGYVDGSIIRKDLNTLLLSFHIEKYRLVGTKPLELCFYCPIFQSRR
jgi:hypothetical protein